MIPEPDEQIAGQADQLPADEEQEQAVGNDHAEHRRREQGHKAEEPREIFVVRHVADTEDENQQADERNHHQHDGRERVQHPAELQPLTAKLKPVETRDLPKDAILTVMQERGAERAQREQEGQDHRPDG